MNDMWKEQLTEKNVRYGFTLKPPSDAPDDSHLPDALCLFCNKPEKSYNDVGFLCGTCVQLLLHADKEDLKRAYKKALDYGYLRKARAIETFLPRKEKHGKRPDKSVKRDFNRARITRPIRDKKRLPSQIEA